MSDTLEQHRWGQCVTRGDEALSLPQLVAEHNRLVHGLAEKSRLFDHAVILLFQEYEKELRDGHFTNPLVDIAASSGLEPPRDAVSRALIEVVYTAIEKKEKPQNLVHAVEEQLNEMRMARLQPQDFAESHNPESAVDKLRRSRQGDGSFSVGKR